MITIMINGESREIVATTIDGLMAALSLPAPLMLVEHNGKALHRSEWALVSLAQGDHLELMKISAGG